jgi:hypothetical protein
MSLTRTCIGISYTQGPSEASSSTTVYVSTSRVLSLSKANGIPVTEMSTVLQEGLEFVVLSWRTMK